MIYELLFTIKKYQPFETEIIKMCIRDRQIPYAVFPADVAEYDLNCRYYSQDVFPCRKGNPWLARNDRVPSCRKRGSEHCLEKPLCLGLPCTARSSREHTQLLTTSHPGIARCV